jgi:hypothetical protein
MKEIKINAKLDDRSYYIGNMIQEMSKIQERYFDELLDEVTKEGLVEGMTKEEIRDWLFDYCFNGWDNDNNHYEESFSEYLLNRNLNIK